MDQTNLTSNSTMESAKLFNALIEKIEQIKNNRYIDDTSLIMLLIAYTLLIVFSAFGNIVVLSTLVKKPEMRTERNMFICNLAISDLVLCLFTIPFSLLEIVLKYWPLGFIPCKLITGLEATSIYVSTFSIMAIALDRYRVIIHSQPKTCNPIRSAIILISIWAISVLLSTPLYWYRKLVKEDILKQLVIKVPNISKILDAYKTKLPNVIVDVCIEEWPLKNGRAIYTVFAFIVQYFVPILVVSIAYLQIYLKLKKRLRFKSAQTTIADKKAKHKARTHRTNLFLVSIALIFGISWLPLNMLNIFMDHSALFEKPKNFRMAFAICHMIGMSSAVTNPFLYGWLNEGFKREFRLLFSQCTNSTFADFICHLRGSSSNSSTPSAARSLPGSIKQKSVKNELLKDTSSGKEIDTLNSTSNQAFNFFSNDLSIKKNLPNNNSNNLINSSSIILNSKPNVLLFALKNESIEQSNEQTLTAQSEFLKSERKETDNLNNKDIQLNVDIQKNNNQNDISFNSNTISTLNSDLNKQQAQINDIHLIRENNNLNITNSDDQTLYLNFEETTDDLNEIDRCKNYLTRTDAII